MEKVKEIYSTSTRKDDHLNICETKDVASEGNAGWDLIELPHCALPEINFSEIDLKTEFLGRTFSAPIMISSMTGGSEKGDRINSVLAEFAERTNIPMGVGSQRIALENTTKDLFNLRKTAPNATLYANLGVVQLNNGVSAKDCLNLIEKLNAQAFILHLNPLQEAIQKEGDRNFKGLWPKIAEICKLSPVPVLLKETGCGLDPETCKKAVDSGIDALDVAGFGGTHWGYIEGLRNSDRENLGRVFRSWGIPTAHALYEIRLRLGYEIPLIASGGIRNGLDIAKALFMGANMAGLALPFLKAAQISSKSLEELFFDLTESIRIALFCTNCLTVNDLQGEGKALYENKPH